MHSNNILFNLFRFYLAMKKITLLLLACITACTVNAQMRVKNTGVVVVGDIDLEHSQVMSQEVAARDTITPLKIYGPKYNGGRGRITFGDQGRRYVLNVAVGEFERPNDYDTDQLLLRGKNGLYVTYGVADTLCYFDVHRGTEMRFNCNLLSNGVLVSSDSRFKENINPIENALESLGNLDGVTYTLKHPMGESGQIEDYEAGCDEKELRDNEFFKKFHEQNAKEPRYGFIAQQVKEVFPDLVRTDEKGYMYVDYIGLVPVLVEAVNELKRELAESKAKAPEKSQAVAAADDIADGIITPALYQNAPNPFTGETVIRYDLPETVQQAVLYIYDMQGKQIKAIPADGRGASAITVQGGELAAGMYIYALIADGREVASKRMILTK